MIPRPLQSSLYAQIATTFQADKKNIAEARGPAGASGLTLESSRQPRPRWLRAGGLGFLSGTASERPSNARPLQRRVPFRPPRCMTGRSGRCRPDGKTWRYVRTENGIRCTLLDGIIMDHPKVEWHYSLAPSGPVTRPGARLAAPTGTPGALQLQLPWIRSRFPRVREALNLVVRRANGRM